MDVERSIVISGEEHERLLRENVAKALRFQELPPQLEGAARRVLQGRRAVKIARTTSTGDAAQLAEFARKQRNKRKKLSRARRKMEKATKKAQRKGGKG